MNPLPSALRRVAFVIWRLKVAASLKRADVCTVFGLDLVIAPGVLHPRHFRSSRILARHVARLDLRGLKVADMGTGCGLLGLLAARAGGNVTAVDINPAAVSCAMENARRNGLRDNLNVISSDVFDALPPDLCFDLVITNPPFYPREPKNVADRAFAAGGDLGFFVKLTESMPQRLSKGGSLLLIRSSDTDFGPVSVMFDSKGMIGRAVRKERGFFETLTITEYSSPKATGDEARS